MTQGESQKGDMLVKAGDTDVFIEEELAGAVDFFEIDYYKDRLQKGFIVYANGMKGNC